MTVIFNRASVCCGRVSSHGASPSIVTGSPSSMSQGKVFVVLGVMQIIAVWRIIDGSSKFHFSRRAGDAGSSDLFFDQRSEFSSAMIETKQGYDEPAVDRDCDDRWIGIFAADKGVPVRE